MTDTPKYSLDDLEHRQIYANGDREIHDTLVKNEQVHITDAKGMREKRMAPHEDAHGVINNKTADALFVPGEKLPEVSVQTFKMHRKEVLQDGAIKVENSNLTGNINMILNEPSKPLEKERGEPNSIIFYTICNMNSGRKFANGETSTGVGEKLIQSIGKEYKEKYGLSVFTTLSPMRDFGKWLKKASDAGTPILTPDESEKLGKMMAGMKQQFGNIHDTLQFLQNNPKAMNPDQYDFFHKLMLDLGTHYQINEKSEFERNGKVQKITFDNVTNFHQKNGSIFANIHHKPAPGTMGDAQKESTPMDSSLAFGLMSNHRYPIGELAEYKNIYIENGGTNVDPILKYKDIERQYQLKPVNTVISFYNNRVQLSPMAHGTQGFAI